MKFLTIVSLLFVSLSAQANEFGLKVGDKAPQISTKDIAGNMFDLHKQDHPVILVFYRGGWCPYCNLQLHKLQKELVPKLKESKSKIVAISVDKPSEASKTQKSKKLDMVILSDPKAKIVKNFNLIYKVPEELVKKYKNSYEIDLEAASGEKHHILPIPAVFVIYKKEVRFAYANKDYKVRAKHEDILAAINSIK